MDKVLISLALIISGLTLGYVIQNLARNKIIALPLLFGGLLGPRWLYFLLSSALVPI